MCGIEGTESKTHGRPREKENESNLMGDKLTHHVPCMYDLLYERMIIYHDPMKKFVRHGKKRGLISSMR